MSSEPNWIREALGPILERAAREQAAAEAHAAECTDRTCDRCHRFLCRCGVVVDGERTCAGCRERERAARLFAPTLDSIPRHFRWALDATAADLAARVQLEPGRIAKALEAKAPEGLLFLGTTGTGKTSLAVAMLGAWVRADLLGRIGALFVEASQLARARARHRLGQDEAPLVASAMSCPLLVLDDLGCERDDRDGCITDVVWARTNEDRPTWITCGLGAEGQTVEGFAEAIARRYDGGFARRIISTTRRVQLGCKR